jgi:hypothetical protein
MAIASEEKVGLQKLEESWCIKRNPH